MKLSLGGSLKMFLVMLVLTDGGCHTVSSSVISAIPRNDTEADFVSEHAGLARAAARHKLSIYWSGPSGSNDNEQQITLAERAIRERNFGIVVTPTALFAMDTAIARALARGIPVVVLGAPIPLPPDRNLSFVLNDTQRNGALAAERVHQLVGNQGEIALGGIDPNSPGSESCALAFESALHRLAPAIRIVSHLTGSYTPGQAETAIEQILDEHPHLGAIYALNLAVTHGAVAAVRDSGRESGHDSGRESGRASERQGTVAIIGNDEALDLLFLVRQRVIDSLVIEDMRGMGEQAVENIVALRAGRSVAPVSYREPMLLNRDNIDTEAIQERLKMDWRPVRGAATF